MRMTFQTIVIGGFIVFFAVVMAVVFIPSLVWHPPQTVIAHPYTADELAGRKIFYSNACNYCHTQYVREFDNQLGPISQGGDYVFGQPMILGSERTGPDLSYIGRKRSVMWEIRHWKNPQEMSPMSIMASFNFLSDEELSLMGDYLFNLGDRVAMEQMILPPLIYANKGDPIAYTVEGNPQTQGGGHGWPLWNEARLQEGKEMYIQYCFTCHGCAGNGLGSYGGTKVVTPADFKQEPFRSMPDDQWFWHVSEGIQGSVMPPWKASLTEEQRWLIIRYVQQVFAQPVERDPDEGDPTGQYAGVTNPLPLNVQVLEEGKAIFIRECWVCHGDAGRGEGVYRAGLLPVPPDFGVLSDYTDFTDADYFWRISEGVPWTAMPSWKVEYSEEDRWKLVHYIRVNFTQTETRPPTTSSQVFRDIDLAQTMPETQTLVEVRNQNLPQIEPIAPSFGMGQGMFLKMCARCHGLSGIGDGWAGQYLDVAPADFTAETVRGLSDGDWYARVSEGVQNSAMPTWEEWMPIRLRWNVIKYAQEAFTQGLPPVGSVYNNGAVAVDYYQISRSLWLDEGHVISETMGSSLYDQFCTPCHGASGLGSGPSTNRPTIQKPVPFPSGMQDNYVYWRISEGVPNTIMPPFKLLLDNTQRFDLTAYVVDNLSP